MSLSGTFATMPFPDLLQWIGDSRRSGMLAVSLEFEERYLELAEGQVVALGSDDPRAPDLARLVLARGLMDEPRLRRALAERDRSHRPLRTVLIDDGHVPAAALAAAVRAHVRDVALQLFLWDDGRFLFSDAARPSPLVEPLPAHAELAVDPPLSVRELLVDGMRRIDEWKRISEVLPSDYTTVLALGRAADLPVLEVLAEAGEPLAVGDLCLRVARPRFDVLAELFEARRRGLIAVDAAPREEMKTAHASPADTLVQTARLLIDEKQFDEAAALLRSALDLDPYHGEARALLHRGRDEQLEELYRQLPPYKVPAAAFDRDRGPGPALTPREQYLLQRIDGRRDVAALTVMTPLGELETLRALKKFLHAGLVKIR